MRFGATLLAALAVGTATVSALNDIYIGTVGGCGHYPYGPDWRVWFVGDEVCTQGTNVGPTSHFGNSLCGKNITIAGHQNIEFTGCPDLPCGNPGPPTGVFDHSGEQELVCCPVYGYSNQQCPCAPPVPVTTNFLCRPRIIPAPFGEEL